ncbi:hypothetical protein [Photobacterium damselae]|uniref:Uncharacterized protein n=1 Tax=Photobacterium damselae TaxID=38293 RepID=A0A2T3QCP2_PHODM|nr:hypothetical protein [Photobacterium damselae]KAB1511979.1 hypothetical protein FD717_010365 [Photobacterium damselae subsp. damselae]PSW82020.1 hypothetical protein CTN07_18165 [Photobacterium damselae]TLS67747.1 hypothetical protein FD718_15005 [Photobacterium damselae subsp. damselae]TLS76745.1 hypothetical protein FD721_13015 [Photobacterium damselae subsp. damselae]TLS84527.1 hypothetical protein FD720_17080 [Photobacterium damselae subsp. damselae]
MVIKKHKTGVPWFDDGTRETDPNFRSAVFKDEFELILAAASLRRNPYKTMVKMHDIWIEVDRQGEQIEQILKQQAEARAKIQEHYDTGGSEIELEIPSWLINKKTMTKYH